MMTRDEFSEIAAILQECWDKMIFTKEKFDIWYKHLQDLDFEVAKKAVNRLVLNCKYTPTIAHIREEYENICPQKPYAGYREL